MSYIWWKADINFTPTSGWLLLAVDHFV